MRKAIITAGAALALLTSCNMNNPFFTESPYEYGATPFDKIKTEHYLPAFEKAIEEAKAEVDAIVANEEAPTFENTIVAMENSGKLLNKVAGVFYNLNESMTSQEMQDIAMKLSPMMTEYSMYVSLNEKLFERIKAVYEVRETLNLDPDQLLLVEDAYKSFARSGANLSAEDKETYSKLAEEASLLGLQFSQNALNASNAYSLHITDEADLAGLPGYAKAAAAEAAKAKNLEGWVFTLDYPSYSAMIKYCDNRELRKEIWTAYNTKAIGGEFDNTQIVKDIVDHRIKMANLLGYETYADYALEERMAKSKATVNNFLSELLEASLPYAKAEVKEVYEYAKQNGFEDKELKGWDFSYWSEKNMEAKYALNTELLKPYFKLENCIDAVFDLATRLYGITFKERKDLPVYHEDVNVYEVRDADGSYLALFYTDFFPRPSKRSGAWMTGFKDLEIVDGVEHRPHINIVCNFTKPTADEPSLITHDEFTTFLHEFGHALHGILAEGRYSSQTGTSVSRDFVELPSQIMENWGYEPEYLNTFAKHYQTGETIPQEYIEKIVAAKNYLAGYGQVRQLTYGILDMSWHTLTEIPEMSTLEFEKKAIEHCAVLPDAPETCFSTAFSHIFAGGYSAGYYSYKWAEVLEADAFSLFKEKGIFNTEVSNSFRENILSKGGTAPEDQLYRNFRGHDPETQALMDKLGLNKRK